MTETVKCTRCRYVTHLENWIYTLPDKQGMSHLVCPRCNCRSYYLLGPATHECPPEVEAPPLERIDKTNETYHREEPK